MKPINLEAYNPVIKSLRSDKSFRLEIDLNFIDYDKFKDIPKFDVLDLVIIPGSQKKGHNPYKYFYLLLADLAVMNRRTLQQEEKALKEKIGIESKKELDKQDFDKLINYLEIQTGRKPMENYEKK